MKEIVEKYLGHKGRMISSSKGRYKDDNPRNLVVFNANIIDGVTHEKLWYGDIDITLEINTLKSLSNELGNDFLILHEMDARFENEGVPLVTNFIVRVYPSEIFVNKSILKYYNKDGDTLTLKDEYLPKKVTDADLAKSNHSIDVKTKILYELPLPRLRLSGDVFEQLARYIVKEFPEVKDISQIVVHPDTLEKINSLELKYLRKKMGDDDRLVHKSFSMTSLCYGPCSGSNEFIKPNTIYIRELK